MGSKKCDKGGGGDHYGVAMSEELVLEAMRKAGKPMRPGEISEMTGLESKEISRIIRALRKKGLVHSPKRCYYAPT